MYCINCIYMYIIHRTESYMWCFIFSQWRRQYYDGRHIILILITIKFDLTSGIIHWFKNLQKKIEIVTWFYYTAWIIHYLRDNWIYFRLNFPKKKKFKLISYRRKLSFSVCSRIKYKWNLLLLPINDILYNKFG